MESYFCLRRGRSSSPRALPNASVTPWFVGEWWGAHPLFTPLISLTLSPFLPFSKPLSYVLSLTFTWHVLIRSQGTSERRDAPDKQKKVPSRVGLRIYVYTPWPSSLLVINATERPLFSTRVCSRSTSPPGIDLRPRGRGLKSVTREKGVAGRERGNCAQALPSSWSRPSRGTALNPIKFLTDRQPASAAFPKIDRTNGRMNEPMAGSMRNRNDNEGQQARDAFCK